MLSINTNPLKFHLPVFEGPLDLLLHLIRENKVDIYDIPIAEITQQYLDFLSLMESLDLAIAGEYLVMAATLMEIKSRMLLPQAPSQNSDEEEEEDPRQELVQRLLEYRKFQATVNTLEGWEEYRKQLYFRGALENPEDYFLPIEAGDISLNELREALKRALLSAGVQEQRVTAVTPRRRASLKMKMAELLRKVRSCPEGLPFESMIEHPAYLYDIVLFFLALLELVRQGVLRAEQETTEDDIILFIREDAA